MGERQPAFNIPASVAGLLGLIAAVHVLRKVLPPETDIWLLYVLAFIPARYGPAGADLPGGAIADLTSPVTYLLVHGDLMHLVVNSVWMLAFGSAVARRVGNGRFLVFSIYCGIAGALTHLALHAGETVPVVGASAAISGQMGGALRILFGARYSVSLAGESLATVELRPLLHTLLNPRMLVFIAIWTAINLLFGLGYLSFGGGDAAIAWEAHIGGFLAGLLGFGWFDRRSPHPPGGMTVRPHDEGPG
ncbi:MAG: rhomboid family intramembrane serine protease [Methyloligellaceae bacterium]